MKPNPVIFPLATRTLPFTLILVGLCLYCVRSPTAQTTLPSECGSVAATHFPGTELQDTRQYMRIRMHGSLRLLNVKCKSLPLMGLSGLAWSKDTGVLYAVSDRGNLFHLQPIITDRKLTDLLLHDAYPLRDRNDMPLGIENGDSEGLTLINGDNGIRGDEELLISFERQPRISRYRPYGLWLADEPLPDVLKDIEHYELPNRSLEGVVLHPVRGILTAPELPLKNTNPRYAIYDMDGRAIPFNPADTDYGAITDISLMPNGELLILERIFSGIFGVLAAVIHRIDLGNNGTDAETVVRFDRDNGHLIDSFEGLAHYEDNHYFLVSDNNGNALQQTLLFYFEILPEG